MNEIQRMIDERTGDTVTVPDGEYVGDVLVPPGVRLVFSKGVHLQGAVAVSGGASFSAGGSGYPSYRVPTGCIIGLPSRTEQHPVTFTISRDAEGEDVVIRSIIPAGETSATIDPPVTLEPGTYYVQYPGCPPWGGSMEIGRRISVDSISRL